MYYERSKIDCYESLEKYIKEKRKEVIFKINGDDELYFQTALGVNAFFRTEIVIKDTSDNLLSSIQSITNYNMFMSQWAPRAKSLSYDEAFDLSARLRAYMLNSTFNKDTLSWACGFMMALLHKRIDMLL
jgi:hypothetical protein